MTNFEEMDFFSLPHAIVHSGFASDMKLVLLTLASHTNSLGETDPQTEETLAAQTGLELYVVSWAMKSARKYGWVVDDPKYADEYSVTVGRIPTAEDRQKAMEERS